MAVRFAVAPEVVTPWQPAVVAVPDACEALDRAGLDSVWPAASRTREQDYLDGGYEVLPVARLRSIVLVTRGTRMSMLCPAM